MVRIDSQGLSVQGRGQCQMILVWRVFGIHAENTLVPRKITCVLIKESSRQPCCIFIFWMQAVDLTHELQEKGKVIA